MRVSTNDSIQCHREIVVNRASLNAPSGELKRLFGDHTFCEER